MAPAFCTVVARNYLAQARVLAQSLRRHHPEAELYVLLVDGAGEDSSEPFRVLSLESLGIPAWREMCFRYDLVELCTAVKPALLQRLFERGHDRLVFLDPDVRVFRPLGELLTQLHTWDVILTPHLTAPVDDGRHPGAPFIAAVGPFNLGFLALARGPQVDGFLEWWRVRCEAHGFLDLRQGLFLDQKWMGLVPGMLDRVLVLRHPGYNVAHWNLNHRRLHGPPSAPLVNGEPLYFFHFSGVDPLRPLVLACPQTRWGVLDEEPLRTMLLDYSADLLASGYHESSRRTYAWSRFDAGPRVTPEMRALFREQPAGRFPDPFATAGARSFLRWLITPPPRWLGRVIEAIGAPWRWSRRKPASARPRPGVMPQLGRLYDSHAELPHLFPSAFVEEADAPAFLEWITVHADELALPASALAAIRNLVAAQPGRRIADIYRSRPDLQEAFPDALAGEAGFLEWLRVSGWNEYRIEPDGVLWFARGTAQRAHLRPPGRRAEGARVVGYLHAESGMGQLARATLQALRTAGWPADALAFDDGHHRDGDHSATGKPDGEPRPVSIVVLTAHDALRQRSLVAALPGSYRIGYWPYELESLPAEVDPAFAMFDEIWTLSRFSAAAVAERSPIPVHTVWPAVDEPAAGPDGSGLVDPEDFTFLFIYDFLSETERKNPFALVRAFREAFHARDKVRLVIKTMNGGLRPHELRRLGDAVAGLRVTLVDRYLSASERWALMAACDAYVSLHRAEGFGFTLAEAMILGKPVVATYYSANVEYMTPWNSFPVPYRLVEVAEDCASYRRGQLWAEPDLAAAAGLLRSAFTDREGARARGERGRADVRRMLSPAACGERMGRRLRAIRDHGTRPRGVRGR